MKTPQLKTCANRHQFYKSSDCPVCPVCEKARQAAPGSLPALAAPARRALENKGIYTIQQLADRTETEILQFHGLGKASLPTLRAALTAAGLSFKPA